MSLKVTITDANGNQTPLNVHEMHITSNEPILNAPIYNPPQQYISSVMGQEQAPPLFPIKPYTQDQTNFNPQNMFAAGQNIMGNGKTQLAQNAFSAAKNLFGNNAPTQGYQAPMYTNQNPAILQPNKRGGSKKRRNKRKKRTRKRRQSRKRSSKR